MNMIQLKTYPNIFHHFFFFHGKAMCMGVLRCTHLKRWRLRENQLNNAFIQVYLLRKMKNSDGGKPFAWVSLPNT